jgi:tetratricopeptide (TPR) repeat protein
MNVLRTIFIFSTLLIFACRQEHSAPSKNTDISKERSNTKVIPNDSCLYYLKESRRIDSILLSATNYDEQLAIKANNTFVKCAVLCNNDSVSPLYLLKAAQLSQTLKRMDLSEKYLNKILSDYPKTKLLPAAKFLLAQYYADRSLLNQPKKAEELLNQIIREYPQTVWAENAAAALQWVGKSDEEILREIKKKK